MREIQYSYFSTVPSTNQILYHWAEEGALEWTVVSTQEQSQGKGYGENVWESQKNKNLQFSFLLTEPWKVSDELMYVNKWVVLILTEFLSEWQPNIQLKWPNDVIAKKKKLCGILIENKLKGEFSKFTVVGVGLNVNQKHFETPQAISLYQLTKKEFDLNILLHSIMNHFQKEFYLLTEKKFQEIDERYHKLLFKKDEIAVFVENNKPFNGIIRSVNENGELCLENENEEQICYAHKQIKMLY